MAKLLHVAAAGRSVQAQKQERAGFLAHLQDLVRQRGGLGDFARWVAGIGLDPENLASEQVLVHVKSGASVQLHEAQALYDRVVRLGSEAWEMPDYALDSFELVIPGRKR